MKLFVFLCYVCFSYEFQVSIQSEKLEPPIEVFTNESTTDDFSSIKQNCLGSANVSLDTLEELNYFTNFQSIEIYPEYADYLSCYWKAINLLQENGEINFAELEKIVNYAAKITIDNSDVPLLNTWIIASEIVDQCQNVQGTTHGERAVKMRNCMYGKLLQQRNAQTSWDDFEDIPNLDLVEEDCVNELKLDGITIEDINRHYMVPENITEFNDFLACYWKRVDLMDNNGNFNISALCLKFDESVEFEILARSRMVYLNDIITESVLKGCREIKANNDGELVATVQNYILKRLPYFKILIQYNFNFTLL